MASQEWSERTVRIGGIQLPLVTGGSGKPLLILHDELGYPGWLNWQTALAKERTLLIPMAPGFGDRPESSGWTACETWPASTRGCCAKRDWTTST